MLRTSCVLLSRVGARAFSAAPEIKRVGIVGMGSMGHGIAEMAARGGFAVCAVDSQEAGLTKGVQAIEKSLRRMADKRVGKDWSKEEADKFVADTRALVSASTDLGSLAECDLVIEAIAENIGAKKKLVADLSKLVRRNEAIFATNTSSLSVTEIAEASDRKDRVVGLHFFNPVQVMKLVEVVRTKHTREDVFEAAQTFGKRLGKEVVVCKDTPGFVVNRLLVPFMAQSLLMLERGDASAEDIDKAMQLGAGHPMGPLTLTDYVGLDVTLAILEGWKEQYPGEPAFVVPEMLRTMVKQGKLGRKTGEGFFKWEGNQRARS